MQIFKCLLFFVSCARVLCSRSFTVNWISYNHTYSKDFYRLLNVKLINYKGNRALNGSAIFHRDLEVMDIGVRIDFINKKKTEKSPWKLINVRLNGCELFETAKTGSYLIKIVVKMMQGESKIFPDRCPIKKDHEYYVKYFLIDAEKFPPYMPSLKLEVNIQYIYKDFVFYDSALFVEFAQKQVKKQKRN